MKGDSFFGFMTYLVEKFGYCAIIVIIGIFGSVWYFLHKSAAIGDEIVVWGLFRYTKRNSSIPFSFRIFIIISIIFIGGWFSIKWLPKLLKEPKSQQTSTTEQIQEAIGCKFVLHECKRTNEKILCSFTVTSDRDRELIVSGYHSKDYFSRLFDNIGNEYYANYAQLSNKSGAGMVLSSLVANLPTPASIGFEKISLQTENIALLELVIYDRGMGAPTLQFRNVPIVK